MEDCYGPFYYKVLKDGTVRYYATYPKAPHVEEYTITDYDSIGGTQQKWHFLTASNGKMCDYESHCGYDRGPRFNNVIRKMLK